MRWLWEFSRIFEFFSINNRPICYYCRGKCSYKTIYVTKSYFTLYKHIHNRPESSNSLWLVCFYTTDSWCKHDIVLLLPAGRGVVILFIILHVMIMYLLRLTATGIEAVTSWSESKRFTSRQCTSSLQNLEIDVCILISLVSSEKMTPWRFADDKQYHEAIDCLNTCLKVLEQQVHFV